MEDLCISCEEKGEEWKCDGCNEEMNCCEVCLEEKINCDDWYRPFDTDLLLCNSCREYSETTCYRNGYKDGYEDGKNNHKSLIFNHKITMEGEKLKKWKKWVDNNSKEYVNNMIMDLHKLLSEKN